MNQSPVVHHRAGPLPGATPDQPFAAAPDMDTDISTAMALEIVVIEPEFAFGTNAAFPEVRLVRARCGDRGTPCAARCPAGSRQIAAGDDAGSVSWVMCA